MDFGLYANCQALAGTSAESLAEDMIAQTVLPARPPAEICEEIERYREVGVDRLVLRSMWPGLPREEAVESIERIGDEVVPNV